MTDERTVELRFPATLAFLRIARLAAVAVGESAGLAHDDLDDLRLAVDEACALLLEADDSSSHLMEVTLATEDDRVRATVTRRRSSPTPGALMVPRLTSHLLQAATDEFSVESSDGQHRIVLSRGRPSATRSGRRDDGG